MRGQGLPAAARPSPGLVYLETSNTQQGVIHAETGLKARLAKMRRRVISASNAIDVLSKERGFRHKVRMVTTTYRPSAEWEPRHITALLNCYKSWAHRRGIKISYVWVLELTKAGKPHYHILLWLPKGHTPPQPDKQGWWKHGFTRSEWVRNAVGYIAKYASKGTHGRLPDNARIDGSGGLDKDQLALKSWLTAPRWLQNFVDKGSRIKKHPGGWWEDVSTGWRYRSPWAFDGFQDGRIRLRWVGWTIDDVVLCPK